MAASLPSSELSPKEILQTNYIFLRDNLSSGLLLDYLYQEKVLERPEYNQLREIRLEEERTKSLIEKLEKKDRVCFGKFLLSLEESHAFVIKHLDEKTGMSLRVEFGVGSPIQRDHIQKLEKEKHQLELKLKEVEDRHKREMEDMQMKLKELETKLRDLETKLKVQGKGTAKSKKDLEEEISRLRKNMDSQKRDFDKETLKLKSNIANNEKRIRTLEQAEQKGRSPHESKKQDAPTMVVSASTSGSPTSEDLVIQVRGAGGKSTRVLGRAMILNSERVHSLLQVEGRELNNMAGSGDRETSNQFKRFRGTCSSPLPLPPSPSPISSPSYWETQCQLGWRERGYILLEMGVKEGRRDIDKGWYVSLLPGSVCVSVVDICHRHTDRLCIQVWRNDQGGLEGHQVGECVTLPHPTPGELTFTFGLVLDVGRGRVGIVDVERGKLLCKIDKVFTREVFPMFYVDPSNDCTTRMRLVSGREISVTDSKIKLIQQALSD